LNVVADQSCNLVRQPLTKDSASQSEHLLRHDIFSSFSLLQLVPLALDILKILEDYPFDLPLVPPGHPVTKSLLHIKGCSIQPVLTLLFGFSAMDMNRLVCLVRIEKEAPSSDKENCRHLTILDFRFPIEGGAKFHLKSSIHVFVSLIQNRQSKITLSLYLPAREGKAESIEIAPKY